MSEESPAEVIFFAALEQATPAERVAYLDEVCAGNEPMRRRVEALLAAHPQVGRFLERPVVESEGVAALGGSDSAAADLSFLSPSSEPLPTVRAGLSTAGWPGPHSSLLVDNSACLKTSCVASSDKSGG
jgi:hypothetical protein